MTIADGEIASAEVASFYPGVPESPEGLLILVNSVDVSGFFFKSAAGEGTLQVSEIINGTSVLELTLVEKDASGGSSLSILVGHEIIIQIGPVRLFGGMIEEIRRVSPGRSNGLFHNITATDFSACLERRLVPTSFEDLVVPVTQTAGDIVKAIHATFLADSCVILGTIEDGPLIQKINFNYVTVANAYAEIARLTGGTFAFRVDYFGALHFQAITSTPAPFTITDAQFNVREIESFRTRETYRNRQFLRGGNQVADTRVESFFGDGEQKTFTLSLPLSQKPVIAVNSVVVDPANIGLKGVDEDKVNIEWVFQLESSEVSVARDKLPVANGIQVDITFRGLFPIVLNREDASEIASRSLIEPGDGVYENLDVDEALDEAQSREKAQALLERYARISERIRFDTDDSPLSKISAGMLQTVNLSVLSIGDAFVMDEVNITLVGELPRYDVNATNGRELVEWLEFLRNIFRKPFIVRDNETIIVATALIDNVQLTDLIVVAAGDTVIGFEEDPYTVFFVGGATIARTKFGGEQDGPRIGAPLKLS